MNFEVTAPPGVSARLQALILSLKKWREFDSLFTIDLSWFSLGLLELIIDPVKVAKDSTEFKESISGVGAAFSAYLAQLLLDISRDAEIRPVLRDEPEGEILEVFLREQKVFERSITASFRQFLSEKILRTRRGPVPLSPQEHFVQPFIVEILRSAFEAIGGEKDFLLGLADSAIRARMAGHLRNTSLRQADRNSLEMLFQQQSFLLLPLNRGRRMSLWGDISKAKLSNEAIAYLVRQAEPELSLGAFLESVVRDSMPSPLKRFAFEKHRSSFREWYPFFLESFEHGVFPLPQIPEYFSFLGFVESIVLPLVPHEYAAKLAVNLLNPMLDNRQRLENFEQYSKGAKELAAPLLIQRGYLQSDAEQWDPFEKTLSELSQVVSRASDIEKGLFCELCARFQIFRGNMREAIRLQLKALTLAPLWRLPDTRRVLPHIARENGFGVECIAAIEKKGGETFLASPGFCLGAAQLYRDYGDEERAEILEQGAVRICPTERNLFWTIANR